MKSKCDNCNWQGEPKTPLAEVKDLNQRLQPGGQVPSGECPLCHAFCYHDVDGRDDDLTAADDTQFVNLSARYAGNALDAGDPEQACHLLQAARYIAGDEARHALAVVESEAEIGDPGRALTLLDSFLKDNLVHTEREASSLADLVSVMPWGDIGPNLSCRECNKVVAVLNANGFLNALEALFDSHCASDEAGDDADHLARHPDRAITYRGVTVFHVYEGDPSDGENRTEMCFWFTWDFADRDADNPGRNQFDIRDKSSQDPIGFIPAEKPTFVDDTLSNDVQRGLMWLIDGRLVSKQSPSEIDTLAGGRAS